MLNLPFSSIIPSRIPPRSFWTPAPTADVEQDEIAGRMHAEALLTHLRNDQNLFILGWVAADMANMRLSQLQIAFWQRISEECC